MTRKFCPDEYPVTLFIDGNELATFQLTKADLDDWAIGYLYSEGIINGPSDLKRLTIDEDHGRILVEMNNEFDAEEFSQKQKTFTAGCGKGVTFFSMTDVKKFPKITTNRTVNLSYLLKKRHEFAQNSPLYLETGGMHGACIVDSDGNIIVREDIGRHNAVDKVLGYAVREGLDPKSLILLTTGRVSYEMLSKAARFGIGLIGTRTAATKQAVQLANFLQIEVVGYIRGKMATVYTSQGKVLNDVSKVAGERP
ncbi:formate dehydrogenase family accessory protein FdhD [Anaerobacillus arseniciselenatis]|uniref:Sulfur carrier protein FdhD n=1 Tax=Anaerobacillus arseniciselenatis TaxID=85682 RepID=A0A1S2LIW9_9BACI|nr:formate dehydrogenase accessory sulfurtransferase FdhD [Anaerobacillus arseniciselenatis]OIJ11637.1 formate dehydrogenase family accessory protein FdhD [Anaerobacillus arseniciselenatis]